jgi:hypothetical protein
MVDVRASNPHFYGVDKYITSGFGIELFTYLHHEFAVIM